jgi:intein/homing endonuclease
MTELSIYLASHNFLVTRLSPRGRQAAESFAKKYVQWGWQRSGLRDYIHAALKVFAAATADRTEFRFHINQLQEFYTHLETLGLKGDLITVTQIPLPLATKVDLPVQAKWEDRDYQVPVIDYIVGKSTELINGVQVLLNKLTRKFVDLQTGKGKATALDSKIKTPGGWSTMGAMEVGTEVIAKDGTTTLVTGVHPQGVRQLYRITFADGRSVECDAEHLWHIYYINTVVHRRWRVVNTLEVLRLISMPNPRVYVDLIDSEIGEDVDLPIDPYTLGVILGDGSISQSGISITKDDEIIFEEIRKTLPESLCLVERYAIDEEKCLCYGISRKNNGVGRNEYVVALEEMDLMGTKSDTKFIPALYLKSSYQQRLALLQGLLDTDGTVGKSGTVTYTSVSKRLAKEVQYLVRSLGGIALITSRIPTFTHLGEKKKGRLAYTIIIRTKKPSLLFRLPRKAERTNDDNQYAEDLKLRVVSVVPTEVKEAQCITIAHPDRLYVTDDFIVTHNSYCSMRGMSMIGLRTLIFVKPMYIEKWVEDIHRTYDLAVEDVLVVRGSNHLMALLMMAEANELNAKIIIISNKTMQNWLKLYEKHKQETLDMGYVCTPDKLCSHLGVGIRLIDEVHQDFHLNFKIDLYTNVEHSLSLSATLLSDDDFMNKMYEVAYPAVTRYKGPAYDKYIASRSVIYRLHQPNEVRYKDPVSKNYSHHVFEQWILKSDRRASNYLNLINTVIKGSRYTTNYTKGDKLIIFCASIDLCTVVCDYLKKQYPNKDVRRYVEEDPWENLMDADIRVTTLQSAGTAVDIDQLTTTILTTAVSSSQSNVQGFGRLRKLKDGSTPEFYYFVCEDVPKHVDYHEKKRGLLEERSVGYKQIYIGDAV